MKKKILFETPWAEFLPLEIEQAICGMSAGELTGEYGGFDDDSD